MGGIIQKYQFVYLVCSHTVIQGQVKNYLMYPEIMRNKTLPLSTGVVPKVANPKVAKSWPLLVIGQLFSEKKTFLTVHQ